MDVFELGETFTGKPARYSGRVSKVATEWTSRGFSCDLRTDPRASAGECHARDRRAVTVLEGEMEFEIGGQVLLIPASAVHSAWNIGKRTVRLQYGYKRR
jgi:hypothetical protein